MDFFAKILKLNPGPSSAPSSASTFHESETENVSQSRQKHDAAIPKSDAMSSSLHSDHGNSPRPVKHGKNTNDSINKSAILKESPRHENSPLRLRSSPLRNSGSQREYSSSGSSRTFDEKEIDKSNNLFNSSSNRNLNNYVPEKPVSLERSGELSSSDLIVSELRDAANLGDVSSSVQNNINVLAYLKKTELIDKHKENTFRIRQFLSSDSNPAQIDENKETKVLQSECRAVNDSSINEKIHIKATENYAIQPKFENEAQFLDESVSILENNLKIETLPSTELNEAKDVNEETKFLSKKTLESKNVKRNKINTPDEISRTKCADWINNNLFQNVDSLASSNNTNKNNFVNEVDSCKNNSKGFPEMGNLSRANQILSRSIEKINSVNTNTPYDTNSLKEMQGSKICLSQILGPEGSSSSEKGEEDLYINTETFASNDFEHLAVTEDVNSVDRRGSNNQSSLYIDRSFETDFKPSFENENDYPLLEKDVLSKVSNENVLSCNELQKSISDAISSETSNPNMSANFESVTDIFESCDTDVSSLGDIFYNYQENIGKMTEISDLASKETPPYSRSIDLTEFLNTAQHDHPSLNLPDVLSVERENNTCHGSNSKERNKALDLVDIYITGEVGDSVKVEKIGELDISAISRKNSSQSLIDEVNALTRSEDFESDSLEGSENSGEGSNPDFDFDIEFVDDIEERFGSAFSHEVSKVESLHEKIDKLFNHSGNDEGESNLAEKHLNEVNIHAPQDTFLAVSSMKPRAARKRSLKVRLSPVIEILDETVSPTILFDINRERSLVRCSRDSSYDSLNADLPYEERQHSGALINGDQEQSRLNNEENNNYLLSENGENLSVPFNDTPPKNCVKIKIDEANTIGENSTSFLGTQNIAPCILQENYDFRELKIEKLEKSKENHKIADNGNRQQPNVNEDSVSSMTEKACNKKENIILEPDDKNLAGDLKLKEEVSKNLACRTEKKEESHAIEYSRMNAGDISEERCNKKPLSQSNSSNTSLEALIAEKEQQSVQINVLQHLNENVKLNCDKNIDLLNSSDTDEVHQSFMNLESRSQEFNVHKDGRNDENDKRSSLKSPELRVSSEHASKSSREKCDFNPLSDKQDIFNVEVFEPTNENVKDNSGELLKTVENDCSELSSINYEMIERNEDNTFGKSNDRKHNSCLDVDVAEKANSKSNEHLTTASTLRTDSGNKPLVKVENHTELKEIRKSCSPSTITSEVGSNYIPFSLKDLCERTIFNDYENRNSDVSRQNSSSDFNSPQENSVFADRTVYYPAPVNQKSLKTEIEECCINETYPGFQVLDSPDDSGLATVNERHLESCVSESTDLKELDRARHKSDSPSSAIEPTEMTNLGESDDFEDLENQDSNLLVPSGFPGEDSGKPTVACKECSEDVMLYKMPVPSIIINNCTNLNIPFIFDSEFKFQHLNSFIRSCSQSSEVQLSIQNSNLTALQEEIDSSKNFSDIDKYNGKTERSTENSNPDRVTEKTEITVSPNPSSLEYAQQNPIAEKQEVNSNDIVSRTEFKRLQEDKGKLKEDELYSDEQNVKSLKESNDKLKQELVELSVIKQQLETELVQEKSANSEKLISRTENKGEKRPVLREYEEIITGLLEIVERDRMEFDRERQKLQQEVADLINHLNNLEVAFNDIHLKYEKSKIVIAGFKSNEELLKQCISDMEIVILNHEKRYTGLKEYATTQLNRANETLDTLKKNHETKVTTYNAVLKKCEVQIKSLQDIVTQKTEENLALMKICDDLIKKVSEFDR